MYLRVKCAQCGVEIGGQDVGSLLGVQDKSKRINAEVEVEVSVMPHACDPLREEPKEVLDATTEDLSKLSKGELIDRMRFLVDEDAMPAFRRLNKDQMVEELTEELAK